MVEKLKYETPLANKNLNLSSDNIKITEYTNNSFIVIRGKEHDDNFLEAIKSLGLIIPQTRQITEGKLAWISPDEYLLILPHKEKEAFITKAKNLFKSSFAAIIDNSGTYSMIGLQGKNIQALLQKISWIDFDITSFKTGEVYSSQIGKAPATFIRPNKQEIALLIRYSYAEYVFDLISVAAGEFISTS